MSVGQIVKIFGKFYTAFLKSLNNVNSNKPKESVIIFYVCPPERQVAH